MLSQFSRTGKHCSLFPYLKLCTEGNAVPRLCGQGVRAPALGPARRWSQHGIRCRFVSSLSALPPPFFFSHNQFSDRCCDSRSESQYRKQAKRLQNTAEVPLLLLWGGSLFLSFFISVKSRVYKLLYPGTCTCSRSLSSSIYKCMDISYAMIFNSLLIR